MSIVNDEVDTRVRSQYVAYPYPSLLTHVLALGRNMSLACAASLLVAYILDRLYLSVLHPAQ
jgi:hypothetical protein